MDDEDDIPKKTMEFMNNIIYILKILLIKIFKLIFIKIISIIIILLNKKMKEINNENDDE